MSVNIAICDDEKTSIDYLTNIVKSWGKSRKIKASLLSFYSAESFLFSYSESSFDIILLDIQMSGLNGVELAKQIRKDNDAVQIVFVTGLSDFIAEGYEVFALHYLMKPVSEDKLFYVLDRAVKNLSKADRVIFIETDGEIVRVSAENIMYAESFAHHLELAATTGIIKAKIPLYELEQKLGENFVRCHRSYIVGLKYISKITKTDVILDNGKSIPLSRRLYSSVNNEFIKYFTGDE